MTIARISPRQAFQQHWLDQAKTVTAPALLQPIKQQGLQRFQNQQLPTVKTESWKYLNLNTLWSSHLSLPDKSQALPGLSSKEQPFKNLDAVRINIVNGQYTQIENVDNDEFSLCRFSQANSQQEALINEHLGKIVSHSQGQHPFSDLNQALIDDGLLIEIKANQNLQKPILIEHYNDTQTNNCLVPTRILIVAHKGSKARISESFTACSNVIHNASNSLCEIYCAANTHLEHNRLQLTNNGLMHLSGVDVALMQGSEYRGFNLALGSVLSRNDLHVNHLEGGSHCQLNGVYLPKEKQQIDFHTVLEHAKAHCTSSETFRGIINHQATATFSGRIHIHPQAQKTDARLSNKNLLLTNQATINTKPELEIYADDVVCAHGATVAKINEESIFYLMSRGVPRIQAEILLSFGFINELFNEITDEAIAQELSALIAESFKQDFITDED